MGDQNHRAQVAAQRVEHLFARGRVEVIGRFVEQQHVGRGGHQSRQRKARLLATGQRPGLLVELRSNEHEGAEQTAQLLLTGVGRSVANVLPDGCGRVEGVVFLREIADLEAVSRFDVPRVHWLGSGDQPQQGGLTRPVESEHHHPGATVDG